MNIGVIVLIAFAGGLITGMIGYQKAGTGGAFVAWFVFGALFPLIGIVVAALSKGPGQPPQAPIAPGWHPDPWGKAPLRYHDGRDWTHHESGYAAH